MNIECPKRSRCWFYNAKGTSATPFCLSQFEGILKADKDENEDLDPESAGTVTGRLDKMKIEMNKGTKSLALPSGDEETFLYSLTQISMYFGIETC